MSRSDLIKLAATSAGKNIRTFKKDSGIVQKEGRENFATAADIASEKTIIDIISQHFPNDHILSEETHAEIQNPLELEHLWVIDPIDGTNNYRYDRAYSGVSIGYVEKGELKLGAIYDFDRDILYFAEKGKGAFKNNEAIHVGNQTDVTKAHVATDNSYDPGVTKKNLELMLKIQPSPWAMLRGSAVLTMADVAAGRADVYFHTASQPWDNAAGFLLVKEADGTIVGIDGKPVNFLTNHFIMGNQTLVDQTVKFFNS